MESKSKEEQLAEASKYTDRAAERRKELDSAIKAGEAAPEAIAEAGMGADAFIQQTQEEKEAALPTGLTYAQADGREDLERQQHRRRLPRPAPQPPTHVLLQRRQLLPPLVAGSCRCCAPVAGGGSASAWRLRPLRCLARWRVARRPI